MALGDFTLFQQFRLDLGLKAHDVLNDTLKVAFIKGAASGGLDPLTTTANPCWGSGGLTNLLTHQVATGSVYLTGGITLAGKTWTTVNGAAVLRASVAAWSVDASGFTNARWAILYNDTQAAKKAIGFLDLGSARSIVTEGISLNWYGSTRDVLTIGPT
jgi:hypothetical protein